MFSSIERELHVSTPYGFLVLVAIQSLYSPVNRPVILQSIQTFMNIIDLHQST